jgi:hypothetical protein
VVAATSEAKEGELLSLHIIFHEALHATFDRYDSIPLHNYHKIWIV